MADRKPQCFSYIRWSSKKQALGTTLERQTHLAREVAAENDLELVEIVDSGISAYKGNNASDDNALGQFISAVERGDIPNDSWLVVENLDRISRESAIDALHTLRRILKLGITVITGMDKAKYTYQSIQQNDLNLFSSIMFFQRAHEESRTKSKRTYSHAMAMVNKFRQGIRHSNGYPFAIESIGSNTWWSDTSDGSVREHPVYYEVALKIIELTRQGWGSYKIAGLLNTNQFPNCPTNKKGTWSSSLISRFLTQKSLFGLKEITIEGNIEQLPNYYPSLLNEKEWQLLRHIKREKISKSTSTKQIGLLSGLNKLKCGHCKSNMYCFTHKKTKLRYICGGGHQNSTKCRAWSMNSGWLEDTVFRILITLIKSKSLQEKNIIPRKEVIYGNINALRKEANNVAEGIAKSTNATYHSVLSSKLNLITQNIETLELELKLAKNNEDPFTICSHAINKLNEKVFDLSQLDLRLNARNTINQLLKSVKCYQIKERHLMYDIVFNNNARILAYRSPECLYLDTGKTLRLDIKSINWSNQHTNAPKIIEDSYFVYKSTEPARVGRKTVLGLDHIDWIKNFTSTPIEEV